MSLEFMCLRCKKLHCINCQGLMTENEIKRVKNRAACRAYYQRNKGKILANKKQQYAERVKHANVV